MKISAVYKITNIITGDFYIGSSKNIKQRWAQHKRFSSWKRQPNNPMYQDFQRYGLDYFVFEILEEVEPDSLKEKEQKFIETLKPTYNSNNAKGFNIEKYNEYQKEYQKEYHKSEKYQESHGKSNKKYQNQPCLYNGEKLTLNTLYTRLYRAGIEHPIKEAKKYLVL